jgi:hypothetical protein
MYNARNDAASVGFKKGIGQLGSIFAAQGNCTSLMSAAAINSGSNGTAAFMNGAGNIPSNTMISGLGWWGTFPPNYMDNASNRRVELKFFDLGFKSDGTYSRVFNSQNDVDPDPPALTAGATWLHPQRAWYDNNERHFILDRITDVMTTRSDTFLVYILVQEIDTSTGAWNTAGATVLQSRRMVAIIDRSMCNYPPGNANYVSPQVVARSVTTK